jgi:hypothetical protein
MLRPPDPREKDRGIAFFLKLLRVPELGELLRLYFNPPKEGPCRVFAGSTFDLLGRAGTEGSSNEVTLADLLAVSLLDEPFDAAAVRALTEDGSIRTQVHDLLGGIPTGVDLASADKDVLGKADGCFEVLDRLSNVGPTHASKLLARKRPHLVPIWDSVVGGLLRPHRYGHWLLMQAVVSNEEIRSHLGAARDSSAIASDIANALRSATAGGALPVPTDVRLLDVSAWMIGSKAKSAKAARDKVGLEADRHSALIEDLRRIED